MKKEIYNAMKIEVLTFIYFLLFIFFYLPVVANFPWAGLLFNSLRQARACVWCWNSTNPQPRDWGIPPLHREEKEEIVQRKKRKRKKIRKKMGNKNLNNKTNK